MTSKIDLANVLRVLMNSHDLSESELSRQTSIGQPVIHRMLSGETINPKIETLRPIANYFAININQLIGDEPLPKETLKGHISSKVRTWIQVPLLTSEQAVLWPTIERDEITTFVPTDYDVSDNAYALMIKDSTMLPRFPEGTIIIVDPSYNPADRDFTIVHITGSKHVTFRQVLIDGENVLLKPSNPDFPVVHLDKPHTFMGVVVQARIDYVPASVRRGEVG